MAILPVPHPRVHFTQCAVDQHHPMYADRSLDSRSTEWERPHHRVYVNITPCTPIDRSVATQQSGSDRITRVYVNIDMYSLTACMSTPPVRKDEYGNQRLELPANALGKDNH